MTETTTVCFDGFAVDNLRVRTAELSEHAWDLVSALLTSGFRIHAGRPYRGSVELAFDNGGHGWDARFGVIVISARSGEFLRMVVESPSRWYRDYTAATAAVRNMASVPVRKAS
jgi:hypothetical protein